MLYRNEMCDNMGSGKLLNPRYHAWSKSQEREHLPQVNSEIYSPSTISIVKFRGALSVDSLHSYLWLHFYAFIHVCMHLDLTSTKLWIRTLKLFSLSGNNKSLLENIIVISLLVVYVTNCTWKLRVHWQKLSIHADW